MKATRAAWVPLLVALLVVILWGGTPTVTKLAAREIDPLVIAFTRTLVGALAALPLVLAMRVAPPRSLRLAWPLVLSGICAFVAFPILFTYGQRHTSAMHGGLILAVLPVMTGLYAAIVERRWPISRWWIGCTIALVGEALLIGGKGHGAGQEATLFGDVLIVLSCLFASLSYVLGARLAQAGYPSLGTTLWSLIASGIVLLPGIPWVLGGGLPEATPLAWGSVLFLAIITSILGYVGWYWALGAGGIARMATLQFMQPISGLVLAFFLLGERPTLVLGIATLVILAGVVIAQGRRSARSGAR